jgi:hypothetical protein
MPARAAIRRTTTAALLLLVTARFVGASTDPPPVDPFGVWATDEGPRFWVGPFPELGSEPFLLELVTGRFGPLAAAGGGSFTLGPTLGEREPVTLRVELSTSGAVDEPARFVDAGGAAVAARRLPSRAEEVRFRNADVTLAGTVRLPEGPGPHGGIVLVHGSGPLDRRWLTLWADLFALDGYAALVYDKRGTGESGGDWRHAGFEDLAGDAVAALELLRGRGDVDPARIGVWGISQGGWIVPLIADRWPALAFAILHAGPATTVFEQGMAHLEAELRAEGLDGPDVAGPLEIASRSLDYSRAPSDEAWRRYEAARALWESRDLAWMPPFEARDSWFRAFYGPLLDFDPRPGLERLRVPILAFFGELDTNVPAAANRARLEAALAVAGNREATIVTLPRANHLFLEARTGASSEIPALERFVPGYFEPMRAWLRGRLAAPAR